MHLNRGISGRIILLILILGLSVSCVQADQTLDTMGNMTLLNLSAGTEKVLPAPSSSGMSPDVQSSGAEVGPVQGNPVAAPLNPAFLAYQNRAAQFSGRESAQVVMNDGSTARVFLEGEIPSPIDFTYTRGVPASMDAGYLSEAPPSVYDLRDFARVSPVKNQGSAGSCWAFATIASLESTLLPGENWDFSENHLKNTLASTYPEGFDRTWNGGGNRFISTAYLTRWSGPVRESDDPYDDGSGISPAGLYSFQHVQNVYFLPVRTSATDNTIIKNTLMSKGAVQASIFWIDSVYYNQTNHAFYNYGTSSTNHAITIVGWNDTYSRTLFTTQPAGDGAFIVKNSWGTGWGDSGYFFISYYDQTIGNSCAVFTGEPVSRYGRVYSYDPLGWVQSYGYGDTSAQYANVFTAESYETLNAIGVYDTSSGSYTARIYLDPNNGPINTSGFAAQTSWTDAMSGYRTITVPEVALKPGQKYSIVVSATTMGYGFPITIESPIIGYSSHATAHTGESYISHTGVSWTDMNTASPGTNVCLKGYTTVKSKIGVVRNNKTWIQDASGNGLYGDGDVVQNFGIAGDVYVTGDWNGDGTTKIGVVRNNNTWLLDASGNGLFGPGDLQYTFGKEGDVYITGDWNGDGTTEIGVVRFNTTWLLDASGNGLFGPGDLQYVYGRAGDEYVTGDWNGNGMTKIGVVRNNKTWYLDASGNGLWGPGDIAYNYGITGDRFVTGDWDGDGTTKIGVVRFNTTWLLDASGNGLWGPGDYQYVFGRDGDRYVTGKW